MKIFEHAFRYLLPLRSFIEFIFFQNFVQDFASTSREDVFSGPDKIMLLNQVICQHFIRQGMLDIVDELVAVSNSYFTYIHVDCHDKS